MVRQTSDVYVAHDHSAWSPDRVRRLRKKYGNVTQSAHNDLNEILLEQKDAVTKKLLEKTQSWRDERTQQAKTKTKQEEEQQRGEGARYFSPASQSATATLHNEMHMPVRNSPSASPNPLKSPVRLPPLGFFGVTSPDRLPGRRSPDKVVGSRSPMMGSPSRRPHLSQ